MNKAIDTLVKSILFIILISICTILFALGFNSCWQCGKMKHITLMKIYKLKLFKGKKEFVCKSCYEVLTERR